MAARKTAAQRREEQEAAELEALRSLAGGESLADDGIIEVDEPELLDEPEVEEAVEAPVIEKEELPGLDASDIKEGVEAAGEIEVPDGYALVLGITKANTVSFMEMPPDQDGEVLIMSGEVGVVRKTFGFRRAISNRRIQVVEQ